jgi:putative heme-binding domain-containing protein
MDSKAEVAASQHVALESWADPKLKITDGLKLWLDGSRQNLARAANSKRALFGGDPVDVWYDGSGQRLDVVQTFQAAQPRFWAAGERAVVRFDGKNACLGLTGLKSRLDDFTVFLVAAPRANPGDYHAFFAINETGKNDYTTGFTMDMTGEASNRFDRLNVEGQGFGGAVNLMKSSHSFGEFKVVVARGRAGSRGVQLLIDGQPEGARDRVPSALRMDSLALGARFYSNTDAPPSLRGFFDGDMAEVLLYDRALSDEQEKTVATYLKEKYAGLDKALAEVTPLAGHLLQSVANPPPVQMFVPGFTVKELPVDLTNINNVRYRPDGKLVALAYNGNVYLLSDSDGDGLEDKVDLFWDNKSGQIQAPIGMALTPPGYKLGTGLFVACKGKLSLIVDSRNSGKADKEITVAKGWKGLPHGVDALGVALDKNNAIYFGLGTADFTSAYLLDKDGRSHYDVKNERGTILKVAPDFSSREIVCTGIRFPVGLAFNRQGDLFATDQEGATWLPNGNPFDELLHILPGRHYGFPPRHPKHLPNVIDEPSVFDYGPQHQSTCGLAFNEPVNGGQIFGPSWWEDDALITGYSRGKLYRTKLAKTPAGYVAQNNLLACLNMLAVDGCISAKGDLVIAVHGGQPDWGNGPTGKGKLYKVIFSDRDTPQPVLAYASSPTEVRIAFDKALDPQHLRDLVKKVGIEYGKYVRPGDRYESLRPGYAMVGMQQATPRFNLSILGAQLTGDRRSLVLSTARHPEAVSYAITLPAVGSSMKASETKNVLAPDTNIDLGYELTGVDATWLAKSGSSQLVSWLPHLDLDVCRTLTKGSADHERFWEAVAQPGQLKLRCQLDLWQMLRPAVQPGSMLDYSPPPEEVTLVFESPELIAIQTPQNVVKETKTKDGRTQIQVKLNPKEGDLIPVEVELATREKMPTLHVSFFTNEDSRPRSLALNRHLLPWAATKRQSESDVVQREISELNGGNWARGRELFFSDQALCSRCHQVKGLGGLTGPDLSNLVHRDYESVLRDIRDPNAAINPDHITYAVELTDGRTLTGVVRTDGDNIIVGDNTGKECAIRKTRIESMIPSRISTMPEGLDKALGPDRMRDLLTFLLTEPLKPAPLEIKGEPPARRRSEVEEILKAVKPSDSPRKKLNIVLSAGPKDHGPGEHDYPLWQRRWVKLLDLAQDVTVSEAKGWPTAKQFEKADLIVFYSSNPGWSAEKAKELDAYLKRGGGLVYIHYAVEGRDAVDALAARIGLAWKGGASAYRHGPLDLSFPDAKHPITAGFKKVSFVDESYWKLSGDPKKINVLASGKEDGVAQPLLWTHEVGKGRVFVSIPGHYTWTFDDPLFRVLILRGMAWAAGEHVDRFNPLVFEGARIQPEH